LPSLLAVSDTVYEAISETPATHLHIFHRERNEIVNSNGEPVYIQLASSELATEDVPEILIAEVEKKDLNATELTFSSLLTSPVSKEDRPPIAKSVLSQPEDRSN
jgi:hypothetical protein